MKYQQIAASILFYVKKLLWTEQSYNIMQNNN